MWKYVAIQGLILFLFFQPGLVAIRGMRLFLLFVAIIALVMTAFYANMDPFVWVLYCIGMFLAYWMAQKAFRWVTVNRKRMRDELISIEDQSREMAGYIARKDEEVANKQAEINHMSNIYDKVKEMSRALEFLDVFIDLSEVLMEHFSLKKARLLILKDGSGGSRTIESVYQIDQKHLEFSSQDKSMLSQDLMFRGEVYPFDLRLLADMEKNQRIIFFPIEPNEEGDEVSLPLDIKDMIALPVMTSSGMDAILTLEGINKESYPSIAILTNRFISEYQRIKLYADVQRMAITDWLTGAFVRRYFFKRLQEEFSRSKRFSLKFSFLMIDLDDFKSCNDQHGHLVGNVILKQTAELIKGTVREMDLVGRYGGEEFAAILLDTDENGAMYVAERIRKNIESKRFRVYDLDLQMTVSIGFATYNSNIQEVSEIVEWADSALYQAKRQGKNRVCAYINH